VKLFANFFVKLRKCAAWDQKNAIPWHNRSAAGGIALQFAASVRGSVPPDCSEMEKELYAGMVAPVGNIGSMAKGGVHSNAPFQ
jgi:hypothetical protein